MIKNKIAASKLYCKYFDPTNHWIINSMDIAYVFEKSNAKSLDSKGQIAFANSVRDIAPSYLKTFMAALTLRVSILFLAYKYTYQQVTLIC